jgi:leukotriene-A4 hydrolase
LISLRDLFNWDVSKEKAIENFKAQRKFMHQTTAALVAKDLYI